MKKVFLKFSQILRETQVSEACNIFFKKDFDNRRATASDSGN